MTITEYIGSTLTFRVDSCLDRVITTPTLFVTSKGLPAVCQAEINHSIDYTDDSKVVCLYCQGIVLERTSFSTGE